MTSDNVSIPRERHPEFYFEDGTACFLIQEPTQHTLYRLYPGLLSLRSPLLQSLFSLPQQENQENAEGTCDENPIILPGVVRREFDHLLTFLSGGYVGDQQREEHLISVLKLSAFFDISDGFQHAVAELGRMPSLDTSLKLQLGRLYHVDHWVESAFRDLLSRPLLSISHPEATRMGFDYFYQLVHTKALIDGYRRTLAQTVPKLNPKNTCKTQARCVAVWKREWWNAIGRQVLHPQTPCRIHDLPSLLERTGVPGICAECLPAIISQMKNIEVLQCEKAAEDKAVRKIMKLQTDEPIRARLRGVTPVP